jgi:hypothetical protein
MSREIEEGDRWVVSVSLYDTEGPLTGTSVEREACKVALAGALQLWMPRGGWVHA